MCVNPMGTKNMVTCSKWLGFIGTVFITIVYVTEQIVLLEPSELPALKIFKTLTVQKLPKPTASKDRVGFDKAVIILCIIINVVEFICYVIILCELIGHQRRQATLSLLKRHQRGQEGRGGI